ncbi:MAG: (2Fe-2S)-binding protein [bacterium]|nr:(2Fe-2S)-binding protein [bacterium]
MGRKRKPEVPSQGVTRRGFITSVGAGAVVASAGLPSRAEAVPEITNADEMVMVKLSINGRKHQLLVEPRWTLSFVLRDRLGLTGTKHGCERGECGSCTVLMNDQPRYSCMTLAVEAEGAKIETVEGLLDGEALGATQQAFVEEDAFQCGYCTSGQVMAAEGLLRSQPHPSQLEVLTGMAGNLCRCGAYAHIVNAVDRAAEIKKAGGER